MAERPSGSSVLYAEWRRGLKDLQNVAINPWNGNVATHEEPGTIGNPTAQIVSDEIHGGREQEHDGILHRGRGREVEEPAMEVEG